MNEPSSPSVKLYSPALITLATFLGAPVAGCILLAHNNRMLGRRAAARQWLLWGTVGTALLLVVAFLLPDKLPHYVLPIGYTVAMHQVVERLYGPEYTRHIDNGGPAGSAWKAVGIGLASFCAIMAVIVGVVLVSE
jgi:hypothetical protein